MVNKTLFFLVMLHRPVKEKTPRVYDGTWFVESRISGKSGQVSAFDALIYRRYDNSPEFWDIYRAIAFISEGLKIYYYENYAAVSSPVDLSNRDKPGCYRC